MINYLLYHTPLFYLTQSLWRDEAFSYFIARSGVIQIIKYTANDFNPPLYYLLLHFWSLIAGDQEIGLRMLSFFLHLGTTYFAYQLGRRLTSRRFGIFVGLFTFFNPMLLYYAFEVRMYALYALCTTASLYYLYIRNWKKYTIATVLGLYSHSFFPLIIMSYVIYFALTRQLTKKIFINVILPGLFYLPWLPVLAIQFSHSKDSWMFAVDTQLFKSVLGNLFTNYEGTPWDGWPHTYKLSLVLLATFLFALYRKRREALFFLIPLFFPLVLILTYSYFGRPIYVNRYLIFVAVYEIFLVSYAVWLVSSKILKAFLATSFFALIIYINLWITPYHKKTDFKSTFLEIHAQAKEGDFVFTKTPIAFLESKYYYQHPEQVFVYNPDQKIIPNYIGAVLVFPDLSKISLPPAPSRTFLVDDNGQYELIIKSL